MDIFNQFHDETYHFLVYIFEEYCTVFATFFLADLLEDDEFRLL